MGSSGRRSLDAVEALGLRRARAARLEGRPIRGRRFGGAGPALLVFGGIHGDEPASVEALIELAARARRRGAAGAPVWLLPAVNPDGVARGRKNSARDVDLNRNFPARSFATAHAPGYFPGPAPLSEPETRVAGRPRRARADRGGRRGARAVRLRQLRRAGRGAGPRPSRRRAAGPRAATSATRRPGRSGSWLGVDRGLPVLTLELPPGPLAGFRAAAAAALDEAVRLAQRRVEVDVNCLTGGRGSSFLASFQTA